MTTRDLSAWESISETLRSQRTTPQHPPKTTDLSGKVVIVTGANTGIGFESARQFLSFGASKLIVASRSTEKGREAAAKLATEFPKAEVQTWTLDMTSYDSIRAFVARVDDELPRLDIVVLNAGLRKDKRNVVSPAPGIEHDEVVQVNYLSTALLSILLLPLLRSRSTPDSPSRLTLVSSGTTLLFKFPNVDQSPYIASFDDPQTAPEPGLSVYSGSKTMSHMFIAKLVDDGYVDKRDVVVNLVDPGMTRGTEFLREMSWVLRMVFSPLLRILTRSPADAASTYLNAALVKGAESHGKFVYDWKVVAHPPIVGSHGGKIVAERLWEESIKEFEGCGFGVRGIFESLKTKE